MKTRCIDRRIRLACSHIEGLESRCLLSATVAAPIPAQSVPAGQAPAPIPLGTYFKDPTVTGTAVVIHTPLGNIPLVLTDSQTPETVANFTNYITSGEYANTVIHRSVPGFIIQAGGYTTSGNHIATNGTIPGEHHESNTTGTIAMALSTGPDSATSEWFINLANNNGTTSGLPNLDNTSDGGPFTAFGNVVYKGLKVADAIAKLPIVNDSAQSGAWDTIPVLSGSNGATVSSEPASNLVTITPQIVPGGLTYSAVSSNPGLVTASVDASGNLILTPVGGGGTTSIKVTATDMGGHSVKQTVVANITSTSNVVTIGAGGAKSCTYTDADGTSAVVTLTGGGTASLTFSGSAFSQFTTHNTTSMKGTGLTLSSITTTGTSSGSGLTITTHGGTGAVAVGSVSTDALRTFSAKGVTLNGNLASTSAIGSISLAGVASGTISASSLGTFQVSGAVTNETINLNGAGNDLRQLTVKGAFSSSTINATGSLGTISALALVNSHIYAGVGTLSNAGVLPSAAGDFSASDSIASVQLKGSVNGFSFSNSDIAAATLGSLTLGTLQTSNAGTPAGVAGKTLRSLSATANVKFTLRNPAPSTIASILTSDKVALGDLVIGLIA